MERCVSCGMPLGPADERVHTATGPACGYCTTDGRVRACEEVFGGSVAFLMRALPGIERELAERVTRRTMRELPHWKGRDEPILRGRSASAEEREAVYALLEHEREHANA